MRMFSRILQGTKLLKIGLLAALWAIWSAAAFGQGFVPPGSTGEGGQAEGGGGPFGWGGGSDALSPEQDQFLQNFSQTRTGKTWLPEEILDFYKLIQKYKLTEEEEMAKSALVMGLPLTPEEQRLVDRAYRKDEVSDRKQKRFIRKVKRRHERIMEKSLKDTQMRRNDLAQRETDRRRSDRVRRGKNPYTLFERMANPTVRQKSQRNRGVERQRDITENQRARQRARSARAADRARRRHARDRG